MHPYFQNLFHAILGNTAPPVETLAVKRSDIPIHQAPSSLYSSVSTYLSGIPIPERQQIMLYLYDSNFYVEHLTNRLINPILGTTGVVPLCDPDSVTEGIVQDFWTLNELDTLDAQERTLRDFVVVGEVCDLVAPYDDSFITCPVVAQTIAQTVLDPLNYHKLIGVKQLTEMFNGYTYHPVITNERTLSLHAKHLRQSWLSKNSEHGQGIPAFLWQNIKKTTPITASSDTSYEQLQKRGEPLMFTASDVFKSLLDYLWTSIDRIQSLNTFNWMFRITGEGTAKQKRETVQYWKQEIGVPKPNTAVFYSDELEMTPVNFPSGVATGIEGLFKLLRNTAGWVGNSRDEDMGDSDSRFASMKQPGITNPTVETLQNLQTKYSHYRQRQITHILTKKWEEGVIPNAEVDMVRGRPQFRVKLFTPEISKQDTAQAATALKTFVESWALLREQGRFTEESLATGEQKVIQQLMSIDLEINPNPLEIQNDGSTDTDTDIS